MADLKDHGRLGSRDREILKDVILTYILSADPVSSRSVAKHGKLGLSAASIRNVMADLEDWGYLMQPHTSAGRVPTAAAYHLFIGSVIGGRGGAGEEGRLHQERPAGGAGEGAPLHSGEPEGRRGGRADGQRLPSAVGAVEPDGHRGHPGHGGDG